MALPGLSEAVVREHAGAEVFHRGQEYWRRGAVAALTRRGEVVQAEVEGSEPRPYAVRVTFDAAGVVDASCSCPYAYGGWCKHVVATLLACIEEPDAIDVRPTIEELLAGLDRDRLHRLVLDLTAGRLDLVERVEGLLALSGAPAAPAGVAGRPRQTPVDVAAIRREVSAAMHSLDGMRRSEAYWHVGGVVS